MLKGVKCILGTVSMEEHMKCMVDQPGPPCGIEPSVLQMITRPAFERAQEEVKFSPSSLSSCHRQEALKTGQDWYVDVKAAYKTVRGTIVHQGMGEEPAYPGILGVVREKRMAAPINTMYGQQVFKGKPDMVALLYMEDHTLHIKVVDYKTKTEVSHDLVRADDRYVYQVNEYGWLASQFLPDWLNAGAGPELRLNDGIVLPTIEGVVVDEVSIMYMDMAKTRTFTSSGYLSDRGKMLGDKINGKWRRRVPPEWDSLELEPIPLFDPSYTESLIVNGIENQIKASIELAEPVHGEDAKLMCRNCPVRQSCYHIGKRQGYDMSDQQPYVEDEEE